MSTAGGVEEDFIKCLAPTFLGKFHYEGEMLRRNGINRIGNLLVPNNNYCLFEDWIMPILDAMLDEQKNEVMARAVYWLTSVCIGGCECLYVCVRACMRMQCVFVCTRMCVFICARKCIPENIRFCYLCITNYILLVFNIRIPMFSYIISIFLFREQNGLLLLLSID